MPCAGGMLLLGGIGKLSGFFVQSPQLPDFNDPLLGISSRHLLLAVGVAEAFIACLCLFTHKKALSLGLVCWLAINFLVYVMGLWSVRCHLPYGWINHPVIIANPSPLMVDYLVAATSATMLIGGSAILWFEHKLTEAAIFQKISCPSCGVHIKFAAQNLGRKIPCPHCQTTITLRKPDNLKISCFFCKEHIEFPAHAVGEKMPCPHCKMDITLKEP